MPGDGIFDQNLVPDDGDGSPVELSVGRVDMHMMGNFDPLAKYTANGQWQPSPRIGMLVCNVTSLVGTKAVALRFRAVNAAFQIDDVYIDPWKDF